MASFIAVFQFSFVTGIAFTMRLNAMLAAPEAPLTIFWGIKLSTNEFSLKRIGGEQLFTMLFLSVSWWLYF